MTNILTLHLDPTSQTHFEALRQQHFPRERNQIPAHLSLFHSLPDTPEITHTLATVSAREPFPLQVTGLRSLGRGVAFTIASGDLQTLHAHLSTAFAAHLIPQDRQRFNPHIVIQNKSTPERARDLLAHLQASFTPMSVQAIGLDLWHYLGGPWKLAASFAFSTD
jgi:2'-5' RNA ligase